MTSLPDGYSLHSARGIDALPVRLFHDIARLRQEVFVVEQECPYLDLDGRDAEETTTQYWVLFESDGTHEIAATIRVLDKGHREPGLHAIGRVATSERHRSLGLAAALVGAAVADFGEGPLVLEAQTYLVEWYRRFGFEVSGPEYIEDGIPHTPMRHAG